MCVEPSDFKAETNHWLFIRQHKPAHTMDEAKMNPLRIFKMLETLIHLRNHNLVTDNREGAPPLPLTEDQLK